VNVDEAPETAARYGVQSIALFLVIRDGEVEAGILGARPRAALESAVEAALKSPTAPASGARAPSHRARERLTPDEGRGECADARHVARWPGAGMPGKRFCDLFGLELPLVQAPMAGAQDHELAIAVAGAGGLGSIPCAMLSPEGIREQVRLFRARTARPVNLNFFCHDPPAGDPAREAAWRALLRPYFVDLGLDPEAVAPTPPRVPFDATLCGLVEELRPEVVSFHFGLPAPALLDRVRATGAKVLSSATTVAEARALAERGCAAIIAQGAEAGGHRGTFLARGDDSSQPGTLALVPQVVDAVAVPVIAAGGIADARGVAAAFTLGAAAVQVGTAYLRCPDARVSPVHRAALAAARDDATRLTNIFTGRHARGIENRLMRELGATRSDVPGFPLAAGSLAPLRARAEARGSGDFSPLWAGQAAPLARDIGAGELTRRLIREAGELLRGLAEEATRLSPALPAPIAAYFAGVARRDSGAMLAPFDTDATVKDEERERRGHQAIREWMEETARKYRYTVDVVAVAPAPGGATVTSRVAGTFPGSPVELDYAFTLDRDGAKIVRLEIS